MASMLIQHKVKDFTEWKKVFDSAAGLRSSSGELSAQVFRDASDPNKLIIINSPYAAKQTGLYSRSFA